MIIGVPKELKNREYRVGLTPKAVETMVKNGHKVSVEGEAGTGAGFSDDDFKKAGAEITNSRFIWVGSNMIVKVKEPLAEEMERYSRLMIEWPCEKPPEGNLIIFAFPHFPANPHLKKIIKEKQINVMPYENIQLDDGTRPVLRAMSKVAAEISVDAAAHYLRKENGGKGKLLKDTTAVVIGCEGALGKTAFEILAQRGSRVIGFERPEKLHPPTLSRRKFVVSTEKLEYFLKFADVVIGAAALKNEGAPKLITRKMLKLMQSGSIIVDPSIDEGGCCETSRPTSHDNPVYIEEDIIHYCVANMPGAVPRSSTPALVKETMLYILEVANKGWEKALAENPVLAQAAKID